MCCHCVAACAREPVRCGAKELNWSRTRRQSAKAVTSTHKLNSIRWLSESEVHWVGLELKLELKLKRKLRGRRISNSIQCNSIRRSTRHNSTCADTTRKGVALKRPAHVGGPNLRPQNCRTATRAHCRLQLATTTGARLRATCFWPPERTCRSVVSVWRRTGARHR